MFIAYIGLLNVGIISFGAGVPAIPELNTPVLWVFLIGLVLIIALSIMKVKGAILISIIATTLIGIPFGVTKPGDSIGFAEAAGELSVTFGTIFTAEGLPSLFTDMSKLPLVLMTIFAFSLTDTFDTIGTFIGTGRRSGIFSEEDEKAMEDSRGFSSRMDKALFADAIATSVGAVVGTSNTTTYVESAAGIQAGGRTGLTSVVVALLFTVSAFLASFVSAIPQAATAPAAGHGRHHDAVQLQGDRLTHLEDAVPAFLPGSSWRCATQSPTALPLAFLLLHHQGSNRESQ